VADGNQFIVSGSHDKRLLIWSLETGEVEHQLIGHTDYVTAVKITKDGTIAISGKFESY
jgi:WD40 repeat protein